MYVEYPKKIPKSKTLGKFFCGRLITGVFLLISKNIKENAKKVKSTSFSKIHKMW